MAGERRMKTFEIMVTAIACLLILGYGFVFGIWYSDLTKECEPLPNNHTIQLLGKEHLEIETPKLITIQGPSCDSCCNYTINTSI